MYRPPSPAFDVPELPTLRRVKPLPKRRRTSDSDSATHDRPDSPRPDTPPGGHPEHPGPDSQLEAHTTAQAGHGNHGQGQDGARPDTITTAQMALEAYYMPVLGGVRELVKASPPGSRPSTPLNLSGALAALGTGIGTGPGTGYDSAGGGRDGGGGGAGAGGFYYDRDGRDGGDDDESGEGDYVDHLQQPGNTKKRKVPANMSGSAQGHDGGSGAEDESSDRGIPTGRERDVDIASGGGGGGGSGLGGGGGGGGGTYSVGYGHGTPGLSGRISGRRGRLTRATLAGLAHKEMLRGRKRQLAAVLGGLAHEDTLALDQALSASYMFVQASAEYRNGAPVRVRLSRRREARFARAYRAYKASLAAEADKKTEEKVAGEGKEDPAPSKPPQTKARSPPLEVPSGEFTFMHQSATSERLVATKEEVAALHSRFEEELTRQAIKAAEAAKQAAAAAMNGPAAKRTDRTKQGAGAASSGKGAADDLKGVSATDAAQVPGGAAKGKGGKKKKRSALANASNPHHLRNYVPSRLPHTGPPSAQQAAQNAQNLLSPLPVRFLSAELPPRRRKKGDAEGAAGAGAPAVAPVSTTLPLTNPAEEWICPFCEYQLFYGDEQSFHRAVRNRKKILRRRRRARERAAAAASGVASASSGAAAPPPEERAEFVDGVATADAFVPVGAPSTASPGKAAKWKEGDRGGRSVAAHV